MPVTVLMGVGEEAFASSDFREAKQDLNRLLGKEELGGSDVFIYKKVTGDPAATRANFQEAYRAARMGLRDGRDLFCFAPDGIAEIPLEDRQNHLIRDDSSDADAPDMLTRLAVSQHLAYFLRHPLEPEAEEYARDRIIGLLERAGHAIPAGSRERTALEASLNNIFKGSEFALRLTPFGEALEQCIRATMEVITAA